MIVLFSLVVAGLAGAIGWLARGPLDARTLQAVANNARLAAYRDAAHDLDDLRAELAYTEHQLRLCAGAVVQLPDGQR